MSWNATTTDMSMGVTFRIREEFEIVDVGVESLRLDRSSLSNFSHLPQIRGLD
jgi:hypothetical protein